jgi:hypothetical protein
MLLIAICTVGAYFERIEAMAGRPRIGRPTGHIFEEADPP